MDDVNALKLQGESDGWRECVKATRLGTTTRADVILRTCGVHGDPTKNRFPPILGSIVFGSAVVGPRARPQGVQKDIEIRRRC